MMSSCAAPAFLVSEIERQKDPKARDLTLISWITNPSQPIVKPGFKALTAGLAGVRGQELFSRETHFHLLRSREGPAEMPRSRTRLYLEQMVPL